VSLFDKYDNSIKSIAQLSNIKKEYKWLPKDTLNVKINNIQAYMVGLLSVFVHNEKTFNIQQIEKAKYIVEKDNIYYISNDEQILWIGNRNEYTIHFYCLPEYEEIQFSDSLINK
jgi:hypothetical protein